MLSRLNSPYVLMIWRLKSEPNADLIALSTCFHVKPHGIGPICEENQTIY